MTLRSLGAAAVVVAMDVLAAPAALAQEIPPETEHSLVALVSAGYAAPTRWTGGIGVLIPTRRPKLNGDLGDLRNHRGLEVEGSAGVGGARLAFGPALVGKPPGGPVLFGGEVLGSVTRTWSAPRGLSPDSTYVGIEGGVVILMVRVSAGVAHRAGGSSGLDGTIFTWSVGMKTGW